MEQNREPRNKPTLLWSVKYLTRGGKTIQWDKDNLFNKWWWESWTDLQKYETRPPPYTIPKDELKVD